MFDQLSDPQFWQAIRPAALFGALVVAVIAWFVGFASLLCIAFCTVPGAYPKFFSLRSWLRPGSAREWMLLNRNNVIFYPDLLTPTGRILRACLFIAIPTFVACLALLVFLAPPGQSH